MARKIQQYIKAREAAQEALTEALERIFTPRVVHPTTGERMLRYDATDIEYSHSGLMSVSGTYYNSGCGQYTDSEQIPITVLDEALEVGHSGPIQKWWTNKCLREADEKARAAEEKHAAAIVERRKLYETLREEFKDA